MQTKKYVRWLNEISLDDLADVGGKNASLGELSGAFVTYSIKARSGHASIKY